MTFSMIALPDHLVLAARWLQAAALGTVATTVAITAVAFLGLGLLRGRVDGRRGISVIIGCFILFGAPVIARGILSLIGSGAPRALQMPSPMATPTPAPEPASYDPYAGAAVPKTR